MSSPWFYFPWAWLIGYIRNTDVEEKQYPRRRLSSCNSSSLLLFICLCFYTFLIHFCCVYSFFVFDRAACRNLLIGIIRPLLVMMDVQAGALISIEEVVQHRHLNVDFLSVNVHRLQISIDNRQGNSTYNVSSSYEEHQTSNYNTL